MAINLKANIIANFIGNIWIGLLSFAAVPFYLKNVGLDGYGIIGFYATVQIFAFLFDFGLSATINREMARLHSTSATETVNLRNLARTIEAVYWLLAFFIAFAICGLSSFISSTWLASTTISTIEIRTLVCLMGICIFLRCPFLLYSSGLIGLQKQVLQNVVNVSVETVRTVGGVLLLVSGHGLILFFSWHAMTSLVGVIVAARLFWREAAVDPRPPVFDIHLLRKIAHFAGGMSGIGILATILVQTDKVILSKMLSLGDFGQYVAAGTMSSGLYLISRPIFSAYYPAFTRLVEANDKGGEDLRFRQGTQLMSSLIVPVTAALIVFSWEIMNTWTGNRAVADNTHRVLAVLALGTAFNAINNIPYALQLSHAWTSLTLKINFVAVIIFIPLTIALFWFFGMMGCALAWVLLNAGCTVVALPIMRKRDMIRDGCWPFFRDALVIPSAISAFFLILSANAYHLFGNGSVVVLALLMGSGVMLGICGSMFALSETRKTALVFLATAKRRFKCA